MHILTTSSALFYRFAVSWTRLWYNYLLLRVLEPTIMLYAMGFGLALAYNEIDGVLYLKFVIPGIMCSVMMYGSLIDGAYGTLTRVVYQGLWKSQLATIITLRQILLTEALFRSFKSAVSCFFILVAGLMMNGVDYPLHVVPAFFVLWLGGMALTSFAQLIASRAKAYEDLEFIWAILITPMFMFSGVFIPVESFPEIVQSAVKFLPLYHVVEPVRDIMLNTATWSNIMPHLLVLAVFFVVTHTMCYYRYKNRIFT